MLYESISLCGRRGAFLDLLEDKERKVTLLRAIMLLLILCLMISTGFGEGKSVYINRTHGFMMSRPSSWRVMPARAAGTFFLVDSAKDTLIDLLVVKLKSRSDYEGSLDIWRDFVLDRLLAWTLSDGADRSKLLRLDQFRNEHETRIMEIYLKGGADSLDGAKRPYFAVDISTPETPSAVLVAIHGKSDEGKIELVRNLLANMRPMGSHSPYERGSKVSQRKRRK